MRYGFNLLILFAAAMLEAGGDALVRRGLRNSSVPHKAGLLSMGALILFLYSYLVNSPPWDFGKLLGVYVAFFFIVAQAIAWLSFGQKPTPLLLAGGVFIIAGGCLVSLSR